MENQEAEKNLGIDNCRILNGTVRRIIRLICFHFHFDFFVPRMRMPSRATALSSTVTNRGFKLMMQRLPHAPCVVFDHVEIQLFYLRLLFLFTEQGTCYRFVFACPDLVCLTIE